jgi:hypothetical protein
VPVSSALGVAEFAAGAVPESPCDADQSVPNAEQIGRNRDLVGQRTGRPGIEGKFSGGDDTNWLTPVANGPVTGSSTGGMLAAAAAAVPGTGGAGGGMTLETDVTPLCTVRRTPGGVRRSAAV